MQVVAGDVFYYPPATFGKSAGAVDKFSAKQKITRRTVAWSKTGTEVRGDRSSNRALVKKRNRQGKELLLLRKRLGQLRQIHSCVDTKGQISRIVIGNLIQGGHVERNVVASGRHSDAQFCTIATRDER